jgi:hypothetical protein
VVKKKSRAQHTPGLAPANASSSFSGVSRLRRTAVLSALALLLLPTVSAAKPRITGSFALPRGLWPGGYVEHGFVAGPGKTVWLTTQTAPGSSKKPVLMRIAPSGHMTAVKIAAPGGIDFTGLGLGPGGKIWFSGTGAAGSHKGVSGTVTGTTAHFAIASDSGSWDQLAVVGSTAYLTTGFDLLLTSTNGTTFSNLVLENVSPFDIVAFNGGLALAGDGAIGLLGSATVGTNNATASLFTSPTGTPISSRYETAAGGKIWFLQQASGGGVEGIGRAGADGIATIVPMPAARNIATGPDGAPWVLTGTSALRLGPTGAVTASVKLPHGQTGVLIVGASRQFVWVATLTRSSGAAHVVRISL